MFSTLLLLLSLPLLSLAQMSPLTPSGYVSGQPGVASWTRDTSGTWTSVTMTLMTGDNFAMVPLRVLATNIDATTTTSYSFTVPPVTPNSAIYFLQFQPANNATAYQWTTRFLIAGADGSSTAPAQTTQPDGQKIPWGIGALVGTSSSSVTASVSGASGVSSASTAARTLTAGTLSSSGTLGLPTASSSSSTRASSASSSSRASSSSSSASAAAASTSKSSAGKVVTGFGAGVVGVIAGVVLAGMGIGGLVL